MIAEFWGGKIIEDSKRIRNILLEAARRSHNTTLGIKTYKFNPHGITGFILLAESHIAIHSWPEINYLAIDIFSCGRRAMPDKALKYLKKKFEPKRVEMKVIKRGILRK